MPTEKGIHNNYCNMSSTDCPRLDEIYGLVKHSSCPFVFDAFCYLFLPCDYGL